MMNPMLSILSNSSQLPILSKGSPDKEGGKATVFHQLFSDLQHTEMPQMNLEDSGEEMTEELSILMKKLQQLMEAMEETSAIPLEKWQQFQNEVLKATEGEAELLGSEEGKEIESQLLKLKEEIAEAATEDSREIAALVDRILIDLKNLENPAPSDEENGSKSFLIHPSLSAIQTHAPASAKDLDNIEEKTHKLWQQFKDALQPFLQTEGTGGSSPDPKAGTAIREIIQQFVKLSDSLPAQSKEPLNQWLKQAAKDGSATEQRVFQQLVHSFQKRLHLPGSYHRQAPVTGKEMAKWAQQSIDNHSGEEKIMTARNVSNSSQQIMPMTKVEQHVIHLNSKQETSSSQKSFIQEFERIFQSSRIFTNKSGNTEMQIKLRPGNLGDLTVKFAQVNGEMAVKILVSTQAAKEMLEGNMSQLRHMFSPQQVVVEKSEALAAQHQLQQESDLEDGSFDEQKRERSDQQTNQSEEADDDELSFHEILMNEKV